MRKIIQVILFAMILMTPFMCAAKEISFARQDTDRLIRLETKLEDGNKSLHRQIDDLKTCVLSGFGITFGGMGLLIGFVIWDRRTALAPAIKKTDDLAEREEKV